MKRLGPLFVAVLALVLLAVEGGRSLSEAGSPPAASKIVKMEVYVPEGRWVKVSVLEGEQALVEDRDLDQRFAFVPVRLETGVRVSIFRLARSGGDPSASHQFVEDIDLEIGEAGYAKKATSSFGVRILEVGEPLNPNGLPRGLEKSACRPASQTSALLGTDPFALKIGGSRCCLTCGGTTSCGCAVEDSCGTCCSGVCCGPPKV